MLGEIQIDEESKKIDRNGKKTQGLKNKKKQED